MKQRIKQLWIDDLLSGEHEQGFESLRSVDEDGITRYCCLGRLCDLYAKETGTAWVNHNGSYYYLGEPIQLPEEVRIWAGLGSPDPTVGGFPLSAWNDGLGVQSRSFAGIAGLIDRFMPADEEEDCE